VFKHEKNPQRVILCSQKGSAKKRANDLCGISESPLVNIKQIEDSFMNLTIPLCGSFLVKRGFLKLIMPKTRL
jgi:hypothetical protein